MCRYNQWFGFMLLLHSLTSSLGSSGAGSVYIPTLLNELGVTIVGALNTEPTGIFAHEPEPIPKNLTGLCECVKEKGADIGIAVDPDADRLVLVNEQGQPLGEEYTLALCTEFMLGERRGPVCKNRSTSLAIDGLTLTFLYIFLVFSTPSYASRHRSKT